jgi:hypothetical protein
MINHKPATLAEAVAMMRQLLFPEELEVLKRSKVGELARFHFNHGEFVRNLWVHRGGSPLTERICEAGGTVENGDDFSQLVLEALWHDLNGMPYDVSSSEHLQRMLHNCCDQRFAAELWPR